MTTKLVKEGFGAKANRQVRQLAKSYPRKGLGHLLRDTNRVNTGLRRDVSARGPSAMAGRAATTRWITGPRRESAATVAECKR